jgi:ribosomal-protein-alanine N-acetyltransferase
MIEIRAMNHADITDVYRIETLSFRTPWSRRSLSEEVNNDLAHYLVALIDGTIAGYCGMWVLFDECHITNIAVDPAYRRQGIGKSLLVSAMEVGTLFGAVSMTLEVRETNRIAQEMYHKFDFVQQGYRKHYYQDTGEGAILLWNTDLHQTISQNKELCSTYHIQQNTL